MKSRSLKRGASELTKLKKELKDIHDDILKQDPRIQILEIESINLVTSRKEAKKELFQIIIMGIIAAFSINLTSNIFHDNFKQSKHYIIAVFVFLLLFLVIGLILFKKYWLKPLDDGKKNLLVKSALEREEILNRRTMLDDLEKRIKAHEKKYGVDLN